MSSVMQQPTAVTAPLEQRIAVIEHRIAIEELTARYNDAWDNGDVDGWVATFVPDGEFVQKGVPQTKGREALTRMITAMISASLVHLTMNHQIAVDGVDARQRAKLIIGRKSPRREPGSSVWVTAASYDDRLVLTDGGWRFVSRTFRPDATLTGLPAWW